MQDIFAQVLMQVKYIFQLLTFTVVVKQLAGIIDLL